MWRTWAKRPFVPPVAHCLFYEVNGLEGIHFHELHQHLLAVLLQIVGRHTGFVCQVGNERIFLQLNGIAPVPITLSSFFSP